MIQETFAVDDFADRLRAAIEDSDMSRYQLAQETGISQSMLSRFVHGQSDLTLEKAQRVADVFGLDIALKKGRRKGS